MPTIPTDPQGRLDPDLPCVVCGYNLRAADPVANCPECGTPVNHSTTAGLLLLANPTWLRRLYIGLIWILVATTAGHIVSFGSPLIASLIWDYGTNVHRAYHATLEILWFVTNTVSFIGWIQFTTPNPLSVGLGITLSARTITRSIVSVRFALHLLLLTFESIVGTLHASELFANLRFFLLPIIEIVTIAAGFTYIRRFAAQIPNPKLACHARFLTWTLVSLATLNMLRWSTEWMYCLDKLGRLGGPRWIPETDVYSTAMNMAWYLHEWTGFLRLVAAIWEILFLNRLRLTLCDILHKAATPSPNP